MNEPPVIHVRTNLYLWLLTGRSEDFYNPALNTGIRYSVADVPDEVQALRELLQLSSTTTDLHALAVLSAAKMSTAFIRTLPHENDSVFVNGFLALPPIASNATMLPPNSHSWPSIDGGRAGQDGFTQLTFTDLGGGVATITTNNGGSDLTNYTITDDPGGSDYRIKFDKAESYGIRAVFQVPVWGSGEVVAVSFSPTRYPFKSVADSVGESSEARRLMNSEGTLQAYSETSNAARKVGMAGLAVIRRMLRYINDDQVGFEITTTFDASGVEPLKRLYEIDAVFSGGLDAVDINDEEPVGFDV